MDRRKSTCCGTFIEHEKEESPACEAGLKDLYYCAKCGKEYASEHFEVGTEADESRLCEVAQERDESDHLADRLTAAILQRDEQHCYGNDQRLVAIDAVKRLHAELGELREYKQSLIVLSRYISNYSIPDSLPDGRFPEMKMFLRHLQKTIRGELKPGQVATE